MKNFLSMALLIFVLILSGCGNNKTAQQVQLPKITRQEAQAKLEELSEGLEVHYDDMKEFTLCRAHYGVNDIEIVPCVFVHDDYSVSLYYHVLYSGHEPLHFDTLYIKTFDCVKTFKYKNVSILPYIIFPIIILVLNHVFFCEEYKGKMPKEVYETLKTAVRTGYAKIRLEGHQMEERELTQDEFDDYEKVFLIYEYFSNVKVVQ